MIIFGKLWDAPVCDDATQTDTPVGTHCLRCDEPIVQGDQGFVWPMVVGEIEDWTLTAMHRECFMSETCGHTVGVCTCTGWDSHSRDAAKEVLRRVEAGALRNLGDSS